MDRTEFGKVVYDVMIQEYDDLLIENVEHEFSQKFEKKIEKLIKRRRKPYFRMINTVGKRAACIALAVFIATATTVMSVDALRNAVFKFFSNLSGTNSTVKVIEDEDSVHPETIEEIYEVTYDLSDYEIDFEDNNDWFRHKVYIKNDKTIVFYQYTLAMFDGININTEEAVIKETDINGFMATYFLDNQGNYNIMWDNGRYIFTILANLDRKQVFELAKSVQKVELK